MKLERTLFQKSYLYFIGFFVLVLLPLLVLSEGNVRLTNNHTQSHTNQPGAILLSLVGVT